MRAICEALTRFVPFSYLYSCWQLTPIKLAKCLGENIRTMRKVLGLTQSDLGKRLEISYQQVQKYEAGSNRISLDMLEKIAEALSVPTEDMLRYSPFLKRHPHLGRMLLDENGIQAVATVDADIEAICACLTKLDDLEINKRIRGLVESFLRTKQV